MGPLRKSRMRREGLSILHGYSRSTIRGEKAQNMPRGLSLHLCVCVSLPQYSEQTSALILAAKQFSFVNTGIKAAAQPQAGCQRHAQMMNEQFSTKALSPLGVMTPEAPSCQGATEAIVFLFHAELCSCPATSGNLYLDWKPRTFLVSR